MRAENLQTTAKQFSGWRSMQQCQQEACRSGNWESVVRFKIFKKGIFDASGCHTGSRNTAQISKDVRELLRIILSRPLAQIHRVTCAPTHKQTLKWSIKGPRHCSQVKRESKAFKWIIVTWICQLWAFSNTALQPRRKKQENKKQDMKQLFSWTTNNGKTYINKVISDWLLQSHVTQHST